MSKISEKDLKENLKIFKEKSHLELEFDKSVCGKIELTEASIEYDDKYGFIYIKSDKASFKINSTLVYGYEKIGEEFYIDLDCLLLKIKKIK